MGAGSSKAAAAGTQAAPAAEATAADGGSAGAEKVGAGLLLTCNGEVLLLQRTSKHNHGTWGLPGGNADAADADLLATATREAREEMGDGLPPFQVAASVLTKRGKRQQKHYTVFVATLEPQVRAGWRPRLNEEHSAWRWFKLPDLLAANDAQVQLHPVVALALQAAPHRQAVLAAVNGAAAAQGQAAAAQG